MTETELKRFTISLIKSKEKENEDYIRYSYYELKVKDNLSEGEIDEVLRISRDYFETKDIKFILQMQNLNIKCQKKSRN